jgi:hypothetical protein
MYLPIQFLSATTATTSTLAITIDRFPLLLQASPTLRGVENLIYKWRF